MPNNVEAGKAEAWATMLQEVLREKFVGRNISNTKFESEFRNGGIDTVHFPRLTPITSLDLATSYSDVTIQNLVEADETFTLDTRKHWAFELSNEDMIELKVDPNSQAIQDGAQAFANDWDDSIMAQHASAGYTVDDGDLATATNSGAGNPMIITKANIFDMLTACNETMDTNNMPANNRWVVLSPAEKRFLSNSTEFQRASDLGDQIARRGFFGEADNLKIYISNNLVTAASIKHVLSGQGKPISFAANIRPSVEITPSKYRESFTTLTKSQTRFGSKVFTEGANKLLDVEIKA